MVRETTNQMILQRCPNLCKFGSIGSYSWGNQIPSWSELLVLPTKGLENIFSKFFSRSFKKKVFKLCKEVYRRT